MPASIASTVHNAIATAVGLVMIAHSLHSGQPAAPIWYAAIIAFGASAWAAYRLPARWMARMVIACNAALAFLITIFLASLALLRDDIEPGATAIAPQILLAGLGLILVTSNIRWLLRRWQAGTSHSRES